MLRTLSVPPFHRVRRLTMHLSLSQVAGEGSETLPLSQLIHVFIRQNMSALVSTRSGSMFLAFALKDRLFSSAIVVVTGSVSWVQVLDVGTLA